MGQPNAGNGYTSVAIGAVLVGLVVGVLIVVLRVQSGSDGADDLNNLVIGDCIGNVSVPRSDQFRGYTTSANDAKIVDCSDPDAQLKIIEVIEPPDEARAYEVHQYDMNCPDENGIYELTSSTTSKTFCAEAI